MQSVVEVGLQHAELPAIPQRGGTLGIFFVDDVPQQLTSRLGGVGGGAGGKQGEFELLRRLGVEVLSAERKSEAVAGGGGEGQHFGQLLLLAAFFGLA